MLPGGNPAPRASARRGLRAPGALAGGFLKQPTAPALDGAATGVEFCAAPDGSQAGPGLNSRTRPAAGNATPLAQLLARLADGLLGRDAHEFDPYAAYRVPAVGVGLLSVRRAGCADDVDDRRGAKLSATLAHDAIGAIARHAQ